jgi:ribosomal protein S18 acetylase RimI-like enzyme
MSQIIFLMMMMSVDAQIAKQRRQPAPRPSGGGKALHVGALTVSSEHRGQGIASTLLKLIKNKASKDRMLWIQLHVEEKKT